MSYINSTTPKIRGSAENKKGRMLIAENKASVLGADVNYRLYQMRRRGEVAYQIYAGYGRERVYCCAGGERNMAESIFAAVVKGSVTPCTLACIVEDLLPDPADAEIDLLLAGGA